MLRTIVKHVFMTFTAINTTEKSVFTYILDRQTVKLEDLKVLRRSPDLFNNVKIGQGQLQLIIKHILFYHILGLQPFW